MLIACLCCAGSGRRPTCCSRSVPAGCLAAPAEQPCKVGVTYCCALRRLPSRRSVLALDSKQTLADCCACRTLDDLYVVCEGDTHSELIRSTLKILEETVDDFRLLASSSNQGSTPLNSSSCSSIAESVTDYSTCSEQEAGAAAADAAAHISRSNGLCGAGCCSNPWCGEAASSSGFSSSWGKPQASSRLSRSSSAGCVLQALAAHNSSCSQHTSNSCTTQCTGGAGTSCCTHAEQHACNSDSVAPAHACLLSDALHNKLSSSDRCADCGSH